jgi:formate hydrogenlyase subunit 6/NADH:ubiquinone oxidoreductase subunit I/bacterioferritin-associated ferredoxin
MRIVNLLVEVVEDECTGCGTCEKVCPTLAIHLQRLDKAVRAKPLAVVEEVKCVGCWACEQRCPSHALRMVRHPSPHSIGVSTEDIAWQAIADLCRKARLNPEQIVCYCTTTRAGEVAAAILKGYHTPEELSQYVGVRTGCKVECTQPVLRLLEAAGLPLKPTLEHGWQLYGRTITAWEVPEAVKAKYASRGFYFDKDIELLNRVVAAGEKE